jgi:hypothetical protein
MIDKLLNESPTEIMSKGGDTRISLDENSGLNKYGCRPYPKFSISYSSCTNSTISFSAFAFIQSYLHKLRQQYERSSNTEFFKDEFDSLRKKIKDFYELPSSTDVIIGSSGTDLELLVLGNAMNGPEMKVKNILLEANEVGSGAVHAAQGQYFSKKTPLGIDCKIGQQIDGFNQNAISFVNIEARNQNGSLKKQSLIEAEILNEIEEGLSKGFRPVIHAIHRSKTGLILPSFDFFLHLAESYGDKIDLVVDACQGRISIYMINQYLSYNAAVLITGSKFYSCPPFAGALLLPKTMAKRVVSNNKIPNGLKDFFTQYEFPKSWAGVTENFSDRVNLGILLRWKVAIFEMNKIFKIPNSRVEYVIRTFQKEAKRMIHQSDFIDLLDIATTTNAYKVPYPTKSPFELNSILTVNINTFNGVEFSFEDAKILNKALNTNLSKVISDKSKIMKIPVFLGQPVKVKRYNNGQWMGSLRIALSSNLISEIAMLDDDLIQMRFQSEMDTIQLKVEVIMKNFDKVKSFIASKQPEISG